MTIQISESEIRTEIASLRERAGRELTLEERLGLREEAVAILSERKLMAAEMARLNLNSPSDLILRWATPVKPPSKQQVRDFYSKNRESFHRPEAIHASHLVKNHETADRDSNQALLEQIRQRLEAGEDFAELAKTYSDCPENGGDLGYFGRGVMVEEFDAVVFATPAGRITPIFETRFGLHIAKIHAIRPPGLLSLNEASPEITDALHRGKIDEEVGRRVLEMRAAYRVEIV